VVLDNFVPCLKEIELEEGHMKTVRVKGRSILLVRKEGQIFGVSNDCPHEGCSLAKGILNEYLVMCPCHGWKFDIRTGQYLENSMITLARYRCKVQNGKIYVEITDKGSSFF
jgi:nitrite reductase/ring-hydroxylating ferredoxin subunit